MNVYFSSTPKQQHFNTRRNNNPASSQSSRVSSFKFPDVATQLSAHWAGFALPAPATNGKTVCGLLQPGSQADFQIPTDLNMLNSALGTKKCRFLSSPQTPDQTLRNSVLKPASNKVEGGGGGGGGRRREGHSFWKAHGAAEKLVQLTYRKISNLKKKRERENFCLLPK